MNRSCSISIQCPCADDNPYMNLSAELPDLQVFKATIYGRFPVPAGTDWGTQTCVATGTSTVSPGDAILQAEQNAFNCVTNTWSNSGSSLTPTPLPNDPQRPVPPPQNPQGIVPQQTFTNIEQSATVKCPDGTPFTFNVAAGQFSALTQAAANTAAASYAQRQAQLRRICFSGVPSQYCIKAFMSVVIPVTGPLVPPINWSISNGALPPGLNLDQTGTISGVPATLGTYMFVVQVSDSNGNVDSRPYVFSICGITNALTLPDATTGTDYSASLESFGLEATTFLLAGGSLPDGLTLNEDGTITGHVADTALSSSFEVTVTDNVTALDCTTSSGIDVVSGSINFNQLVWDEPIDVEIPAGNTANHSEANAFNAASGSLQSLGPFSDQATTNFHAMLVYTGPAVSGVLSYNLLQFDSLGTIPNFAGVIFGAAINQDGVTVAFAQKVSTPPINDPPGAYTLPFDLVAGGNSVIEVFISISSTFAASLSPVVTFTANVTPAS